MVFISNIPQIHKFLSENPKIFIKTKSIKSRQQSQIKNQSFSNGEIIAIWRVVFVLKNEVINKKILFLLLYLFFLFLGVLKALVQASFRAYKATKIVQ